ncbi:hypothetical protein D9758_014654 [Tetrapyrgos nigripes]|uniref:Uncharacterized protein n=1 Tax=Tetrapyrgos nigripes TaxID=182062 RepID=A0A8H5CX18_9AGAR|nr:hypothetical protein D9758_014654 [Tetrapyrgos nigripes]
MVCNLQCYAKGVCSLAGILALLINNNNNKNKNTTQPSKSRMNINTVTGPGGSCLTFVNGLFRAGSESAGAGAELGPRILRLGS